MFTAARVRTCARAHEKAAGKADGFGWSALVIRSA
jgi:hypothetical protein